MRALSTPGERKPLGAGGHIRQILLAIAVGLVALSIDQQWRGASDSSTVSTTELADSKANVRVVVVGAGISGLAAATRLTDAGFDDVVVLDAQSYIGGRLTSDTIVNSDDGSKTNVEVGGQWLHTPDTEIYRRAASARMLLTDSEGAVQHDDALMESCFAYLGDLHGRKPHLLLGEAVREIDEHMDFAQSIVNGPKDRDEGEDRIERGNMMRTVGDVVMQKYTDVIGSGTGRDSIRLHLGALDLAVRLLLDDYSSSSLWQVGLAGDNEDTRSGAYNTRLTVTYRELFELLFDRFPADRIRLSSPVKSIRFVGDGGITSMESRDHAYCSGYGWIWQPNDSAVESSGGKPISLTYGADGGENTIDADHVVFTGSTGYLKASHEKLFSPRLSQKKAEAIDCMGMGNLGKLWFRFPRDSDGMTWWQRAYRDEWSALRENSNCTADDLYGLHFLWFADDENTRAIFRMPNADKWTRFISAISFIPSLRKSDVATEYEADTNWLMVVVPGSMSWHVETLDNAAIMSDLAGFLRERAGLAWIPEPTHLVRRRWGLEEYFRGTYSYPSIECDMRFGHSGAAHLDAPDWHYTPRGRSSAPSDKQVPALFFAGEAVSTAGLGYMHTAYDSGVRQAQRIADLYTSSASGDREFPDCK